MSASSDSHQPVVTDRSTFTFPNKAPQVFTIRLDARTLQLLPTERTARPSWTDLSHHKCPNCPLKEAEHPACPAAVSLIDVVDFLSHAVSHDTVEVCIESEARRYVKETTMQQALSSLVGLYMATSGCPVIGKFRPLARQHLPFANTRETRFRVLSMYLLAQYFVAKRGHRPDWELKGILDIYRDVRTVNKHFCKRLSALQGGDASLNALMILDVFADSITFSLEEDALDELEALFTPYLSPEAP